jgi:hypothetical protein
MCVDSRDETVAASRLTGRPGQMVKDDNVGQRMSRYKLSVMPAAWGLPTFHPECLSSYTYLKLSGVDVRASTISTTAAAQFGELNQDS